MKRLLIGVAIVLSVISVVSFGWGHRDGFSVGFGPGYSGRYYDPYYADPVYAGGYDSYYYRPSKGERIAGGILGAAGAIADAATSGKRRYYRDGYYY